MQPAPLELGLFIAALIAEILVVLLGVVATNGAVKDILAVMSQLPSRVHKDDKTNEMTSRKKARREFVCLVFWRSLPGILLMTAGVLHGLSHRRLIDLPALTAPSASDGAAEGVATEEIRRIRT